MTSTIAAVSRIDQEWYGELAYRREIGQRIRTERFWLNLRQEELAARAQVSRHFVSSIERGQHGLDAWRLRRLAHALGHDIGWLLGEPVDRPRASVDQEMPR